MAGPQKQRVHVDFLLLQDPLASFDRDDKISNDSLVPPVSSVTHTQYSWDFAAKQGYILGCMLSNPRDVERPNNSCSPC